MVTTRTAIDLTLRQFQPGDETAFRELNEAWISKYFVIEEKDLEVLHHPVEEILDKGGRICMAVVDGAAVGCCALLAMGDACFEIGKMCVGESRRGHGIGRKLLAYTIEQGRALGARRLYLETNAKLPDAIHLYQSLGFSEIPADRVHPSPYARAGVFMEMFL